MPNTYSQISMHFVFAVKNRQALILPEFKERLNQYLSTMITNRGQKSLAVNGTADHIHLFVGMDASLYIPEFIKEIKTASTKFINQNFCMDKQFRWQEGYGAFAYSRSHRDRVIRYIINQEEHHAKKTFQKEYHEILTTQEVEYSPQYLFEFFD